MKNTLKVAFPSGIGDTLWLMTKMQSLLRKEKKEFLHISICQDSTHRSERFLKSFSFVSDVGYTDWGMMRQPDVNQDGSYNCEISQPNWHNEFDWFLQVNNHLERGNRLETWYPEWETNWDVMNDYHFHKEEIKFGQNIKNRFGRYCVFYFGPENGNINCCGHNRGPMWKPEDWKILGDYFREQGLQIIATGASYDRSYFEKYIVPTGLQCYDLIGRTEIGLTLQLLKHAEFTIGYQSGICIVCPFMNVRAGGFWRPYGNSIDPNRFLSFSNDMSHCWVPPKVLERGDWLPLIYGRDTPESIFEYVRKNWI